MGETMKKVLSAILIIILAYSIIFATAVFAASNVAIQTNSDYTASKTTESKDFSTTVGSRIQLYVRLISSGEVGGNPIKGAYWESSNVQVVSMSSNGLITAQKEGTATITVTYDGGQDTIKAKIHLLVVELVEEVLLNNLLPEENLEVDLVVSQVLARENQLEVQLLMKMALQIYLMQKLKFRKKEMVQLFI